MRFNGQNVLITGAAVGIGRATALRFAEEGANVVLFDMNEEKLQSVKEEVEAFGVRALIYKVDVSDEQAVKSSVADALEQFGSIQVLVNNAGLWRYFSMLTETDPALYEKLFRVNFMGAVYCEQAVLPSMQEAGYGRIINVASVAGVYGNRRMSAYSASKAAMIAMTQSLAKEVCGYGITVNAISPGTVSNSEDNDIDATQPSEKLSYLGRTGSDRENADLILFLADKTSGYILGQNIQIDGCRKSI